MQHEHCHLQRCLLLTVDGQVLCCQAHVYERAHASHLPVHMLCTYSLHAFMMAAACNTPTTSYKIYAHPVCLSCCISPVVACDLQIPFNRNNIEDMLRVSDRLQVTSIKDACISYLDQEMSSYNVMETLLL